MQEWVGHDDHGGVFQALAGLVAIFENESFIPYYPFWSLLIIAIDVLVIWAIAAHGGTMRDTGA